MPAIWYAAARPTLRARWHLPRWNDSALAACTARIRLDTTTQTDDPGAKACKSCAWRVKFAARFYANANAATAPQCTSANATTDTQPGK